MKVLYVCFERGCAIKSHLSCQLRPQDGSSIFFLRLSVQTHLAAGLDNSGDLARTLPGDLMMIYAHLVEKRRIRSIYPRRCREKLNYSAPEPN